MEPTRVLAIAAGTRALWSGAAALGTSYDVVISRRHEAVVAAAKLRPQVVLCDLTEDGLEVFEELKEVHPTAEFIYIYLPARRPTRRGACARAPGAACPAPPTCRSCGQ